MGYPSAITVIAIDDDSVDLKVLERILLKSDRWDVEFLGFHESEPAMQALARHPVDVIILDYSLVTEMGIDVLRKIRISGSDCPVIMMSGHDTDEIREECLENGAADYFVKGAVDPDALIDSIDRAISEYLLLKSH